MRSRNLRKPKASQLYGRIGKTFDNRVFHETAHAALKSGAEFAIVVVDDLQLSVVAYLVVLAAAYHLHSSVVIFNDN